MTSEPGTRRWRKQKKTTGEKEDAVVTRSSPLRRSDVGRPQDALVQVAIAIHDTMHTERGSCTASDVFNTIACRVRGISSVNLHVVRDLRLSSRDSR